MKVIDVIQDHSIDYYLHRKMNQLNSERADWARPNFNDLVSFPVLTQDNVNSADDILCMFCVSTFLYNSAVGQLGTRFWYDDMQINLDRINWNSMVRLAVNNSLKVIPTVFVTGAVSQVSTSLEQNFTHHEHPTDVNVKFVTTTSIEEAVNNISQVLS